MSLKFVGSGSKLALKHADTAQGSKLAAQHAHATQTEHLVPPNPLNLADLLAALKGTATAIYLKGGVVAGHLTKFFNLTPEQIKIRDLVDVGPLFRLWLRERHYSRQTTAQYSYWVRVLLRKAEELGWLLADPELIAAWQPALAAMPKKWPGRSIVAFAIKLGKTPAQFGDCDLDQWGEILLQLGRRPTSICWGKSKFRTALRKSGLAIQCPGITYPCDKKPNYGIALKFFPPPLQAQVNELLEWKTKPYVKGRPWWLQVREVTAVNLARTLSGLFGFVTNIQKRKDVTSVTDLVTRELVSEFIDWQLNTRKVKPATLNSHLSLLHAALRHHPAYGKHQFDWLGDEISGLPREKASEKKKRKQAKFVEYEILATIPAKIREQRKEAQKRGSTALAWCVHDELLFAFLLRLAWRQRNVRECKTPDNLFYSEIVQPVNMTLPDWVQEKLKINAHEKFWQFEFSEEQTKTHQEVRSILPRQLVPLLEEYITIHRPVIVGSPDLKTLFLNRKGGALRSDQIRSLVANLTKKHIQKRITPHPFRDSLVYWGLNRHPEQIAYLSKILWHKNLATTANVYGWRFDESNGLVKLEEWLEESANKSGKPKVA